MKTIVSLSLLIFLFFNGCSFHDVNNESLIYTKIDKDKRYFHEKEIENIYIDYSLLAKDAVQTIFQKMEKPEKLIVTDFVDITSLDNNTKLGYVLSNNIKNVLINEYNEIVIEAEVSKYFKISGNGLKILSRDIKKLRSTNFNVQYAVVGTYTYTKNEFVVFVKLIDLESGVIKGSYAKTFPMGEGLRLMLQNK
jgi:TolB-like protein